MKENRMTTQIIERDQILTIPRKSLHIVRKSCQYYENSLDAAKNSSKLILHKSHKLPIVVAHDFGLPLILIPTMSFDSEHNVLIALHAIENFQGDSMGCTIYLENNYSIKVNVSEATIYRQYSLGTIIEKNFHKKQRQLSRHSSFGNVDLRFLPPRSRL